LSTTEVFETFQTKFSKIGGRLAFYSFDANEFLRTILVEIGFENYASIFVVIEED